MHCSCIASDCGCVCLGQLACYQDPTSKVGGSEGPDDFSEDEDDKNKVDNAGQGMDVPAVDDAEAEPPNPDCPFLVDYEGELRLCDPLQGLQIRVPTGKCDDYILKKHQQSDGVAYVLDSKGGKEGVRPKYVHQLLKSPKAFELRWLGGMVVLHHFPCGACSGSWKVDCLLAKGRGERFGSR